MTLTLFRVTNDAIEPLVDGPEEDDKFLVTHLPPGIKEEDLKRFVEENSSNSVASMELQSGRALLTLNKPYGISSTYISSKSAVGYHLNVVLVSLCTTLLLYVGLRLLFYCYSCLFLCGMAPNCEAVM